MKERKIGTEIFVTIATIVVLARAIARRAYRTTKENLFVGVGVVHVAGIAAALLGLIGPI